MDNILIFGTGSVANKLLEDIDNNKVKILAFINSDNTFGKFREYNVITPENICNYEYDYIIIASGYVKDIIQVLKNYNIPYNKIVSFIYDDSETYEYLANEMSDYLNKKYNRDKIFDWMKTPLLVPKFYPSTMWNADCMLPNIYKDFVREQTVKLISKVINDKEISGAVAELGVFRGDFTVVINSVFENRKLYLFDTFEGFSEKDIDNDVTMSNKEGEHNKFRNTSMGFVLNRLTYKDNVIFKKGYFPDTFDLTNEKFSFVSIDLNLFNPVKSALELFYPNMEKGGYILISDYYAPFYEGTRKAVDEWCKNEDINIIPVADFYGSVLIVKE